MTVEAIAKSNRWSKGPHFLWQNEENWPKGPAVLDDDEREEEPCASEERRVTFISLACPTKRDIDKVFERFSSWFKVKKFVPWMLRLRANLRDAAAKKRQGEAVEDEEENVAIEKKFKPLEVEELKAAEKAIIKFVQGASFYKELLSLKTAHKQVKKSSSIVKLDPVLIEGIMYVGGRLHNSPLTQEPKHPALLPKDHHVSSCAITT